MTVPQPSDFHSGPNDSGELTPLQQEIIDAIKEVKAIVERTITRMDRIITTVDRIITTVSPGSLVSPGSRISQRQTISDHLKLLRYKAADSTTLKTIKKEWKNPNDISRCLLGVSLDQAGTCLRALRDRKMFAGDELVDIRILLVKSNMFLRKWEPQGPEVVTTTNEPDGPGPYDLEVQKGVTDTRRTGRFLLYESNLVELVQRMINMHLYQPGQAREDSVWDLKQILQVIRCIDLLEIQYDSVVVESELGTKVFGSLTLFSQKMLVDPRPRGLVLVPDPNSIDITEEVKGFVSEFLCYMILLGCSKGLMTDGEVLFLIEINLKVILDPREETPKLPIIVYASHIKATGPSYAESLISWLLQWMDDRVYEEMDIVRERYRKLPGNEGAGTGNSGSVANQGGRKRSSNLSYERLNQTAPGPKSAPAPLEGEKLLQLVIEDISEPLKGDFPPYQVLKVNSSKVPFFKHNLQPHESLVFKIFDPEAAKKSDLKGVSSEFPLYMKEDYEKELKCIQRLPKGGEFNNCYFDHKDLWATVNTPDGYFSGRCLLSKFIESVPLTKKEEIREKVQQQIKILHAHGIFHNDIAERNILYTKEGKVYIIDFGNAELDVSAEKREEDLEMWEKVYSYLPEPWSPPVEPARAP